MWAQSAAEIGRIIASARRHRGLTQTTLARSLGVSQNWISEIERGKDTAQIGKILRILSFFGVGLEVGEAPWGDRTKRPPPKRSGTWLAAILAPHTPTRHRRKPSE